MSVKIEKARRKQAKLRMAITGPSGSGKTFSALLIAFGLGSKVLLGDTENRSASLYAEMDEGPLAGKEFDTVVIDPPYTVAKYTDVIKAAEDSGYDVLILDSISHAWAGEGGLLDKKEALDSRGGATKNQWANWRPITKEHEAFKARLLQCGVHLICTMRSKQDYILEQKDGKQTPRKVGMAPIQREGMEYEFTAVLDMAMDHSALASKHRTGSLLEGGAFVPGVETGEMLSEWLDKGAPDEPMKQEAKEPEKERPKAGGKGKDKPKADGPLTPEQASSIFALISSIQGTTGQSDAVVFKAIVDYASKTLRAKIEDVTALTETQATALIERLGAWDEAYKKKAREKEEAPPKDEGDQGGEEEAQ